MFLPDANTNPYPDASSLSASAPSIPISNARPSVKHSNTRLHEDDPTWTAGVTGENGRGKSKSVRGSSPSRSLIDAAVRGTPCKFFFCFVLTHLTWHRPRHRPTAKREQLPTRPTRRLALPTRPPIPPHLGHPPRHPSRLGGQQRR